MILFAQVTVSPIDLFFENCTLNYISPSHHFQCAANLNTLARNAGQEIVGIAMDMSRADTTKITIICAIANITNLIKKGDEGKRNAKGHPRMARKEAHISLSQQQRRT